MALAPSTATAWSVPLFFPSPEAIVEEFSPLQFNMGAYFQLPASLKYSINGPFSHLIKSNFELIADVMGNIRVPQDLTEENVSALLHERYSRMQFLDDDNKDEITKLFFRLAEKVRDNPFLFVKKYPNFPSKYELVALALHMFKSKTLSKAQVNMIKLTSRWFGSLPLVRTSNVETTMNMDFITEQDIKLILSMNLVDDEDEDDDKFVKNASEHIDFMTDFYFKVAQEALAQWEARHKANS